jgi:hypothetical protein
MGFARRVFFLHDDGRLEKIALHRFSNLFERDRSECFSQLAGKRVRYVHVFLETQDRKPKSIMHVEFGFVMFDKDGRLDEAKFMEQLGRTMHTIRAPLARKDDHVIDASHIFNQKRYAHDYKWKPNEEEAQLIAQAISRELKP